MVAISILISLPISILLLIWMIRIKKNNPFPKYSIVKMLIGGVVAMIIAALLEELAKFIVMKLCLRKPSALTNRLDAMICL